MTDPSRGRVMELLAGRALEGLTPLEEAELAALLPSFPDLDPDELDRVAASVAAACLDAPRPMPELLATRIAKAAPAHLPRRRRRWPWAAATGWIAAAALLGVLIWRQWPTSAETGLSRLLSRGGGVLRVLGKVGDVVWSNERQEGYLILRLKPNDPAVSQYQLWIFDETRDGRFPVDGGVFDMPDKAEAVVPIRAKLPVGKPTLFAVTVEKPGGVVVSDRQRIVLAAKP